jgi:uncharacterized membrane protein YedE/YeeE
MALAGRRLSASGGYESIVSILSDKFGWPWADSLYFTTVKPPVLDFQILEYIGIILGAFIASQCSGEFRWRWLPEREWVDRFGNSRLKRWLTMFIGAVIIEFGAGIAGGCTSGLGISGMMLLSPAAIMFIVGVFTAGIIMTKILYGRNYR